MRSQPRTVGSTFAGVGGFDIAFERAGADIAWQVEWDKHCQRVLSRHWPTTPIYGDITQVRTNDLTPINILVGGFPCQDLSIGGKQAGLAGGRSGLFYDFARIAADLEPEWLVIENVPGLLTANNGRDMGAVLSTLSDIGYVGSWRVFESRGFGVPQKRRRVFIIGHRGNRERAEHVLFEPQGVPGDLRSDDGSRGADTPSTPVGVVTSDYPLIYRKSRRPRTMEAETWVPDWYSNTLNTFDIGDVRSTVLIVPDERSGPRRMTPREWEIAQGFPADWTRYAADGTELTDNQRYRMMGNAVSVPVVEWIARRLLMIEEEDVSITQVA